MNTSHAHWIDDFFGSGNGLSLEKIKSSGYPGPLQSRLDIMMRPGLSEHTPFVLPRVNEDRQLSFYIVAETRRQLMEVNRVLYAFLGNVNTFLDPRIFVTADDDIEESLLARYPEGFSRVFVPKQVSQDKPSSYTVFDTLNRAIEQYGNKPASLAVVQRNTGRILRDFFTACARQDKQAAAAYFEEAKATGKLSARNLISLELQLLAASSRWSALLQHPRLSDLLSARAPRRVVQIVLRAIDQAVINADAYLEHEVSVVRASLQEVDSIFLRRPDLDQDDPDRLWRTWCVGAATFGNSALLDPDISERVGVEWAIEIAGWAGLAEPPKTHRELDSFAEILSASPTFEAATSLLQQSLLLNPEEGLKIYTRLIEYPDEIISELKAHKSLCGVWESLESEYANPTEVGDWAAWLDSLVKNPSEALPIHAISESCVYWSADDWNEQEVTEKFYALAESNFVSEVRNILPILLEWMRDRKVAISASVIESVALVLSSDEAFSVQDLALFADLISSLIQVAHKEDEYQAIVVAAQDCWRRVQSVDALEPALEIMDTLLDGVCADKQSRLQFWNLLQEFCLGSWKRLSLDQKLLVLRCSEDLTGTVSHFPTIEETDSEDVDLQRDLAGIKLAIYTLTEGAARRARAVLEQMFPALDIKLNHDKTATSALVNLAKTADFFVFSSRSAAHQAFYPVTKERDDILYPAGKGSSSIIRCFLEALKNS